MRIHHIFGKEKNRWLEQIRSGYELEQRMANQLRQAPKSDRLGLYSSIYDEFYERQGSMFKERMADITKMQNPIGPPLCPRDR